MGWKHRYTVLSILFFTWLLCYLDRMVMASAIPFIAKDLKLSPLAMGQVLSAFFVGYAIMQIPGGLLADRFGPRIVLTISLILWSIMTALTGTVAGLMALLTIRTLFGLGEGPYPSSASKALSNWFPLRELGRAQGIQMGSTYIGATVAPLFVVALITTLGWRSVFYMLFAPGILLAILIWKYVKDAPAESPGVKPDELAEYEARSSTPAAPAHASLSASLRTPLVLWCALTLLFSNMVAWGLVNWLPTYLLQARGFSMEKTGVFAALTNLASAIGSLLSGYIGDRFFKHNLRIPIMGGLVVGSVFIYLAAKAPSGEWAVVYLACAFLLIIGITNTAIFTLPLLIVPKLAVGSAFGTVNTAGQIAGALSPLLVGYVLSVTGSDFKLVLYLIAGTGLLALIPASRIQQTAVKSP
jgi:sugar phosphate permease